ncbi:DUF6525 family protein [Symmachiella dynata]|uniref:DUF6525 family protein n=1 Tax=Symmachiella dynata TaxID=2527995 RepID=UPI003B831593
MPRHWIRKAKSPWWPNNCVEHWRRSTGQSTQGHRNNEATCVKMNRDFTVTLRR